jgi:hypothetical protein
MHCIQWTTAVMKFAMMKIGHPNRAVVVGLILYAAGLAVLLQDKNFELGGALVVLVFFGLIFPALAWLATIRAVPLSISVQQNRREMLVLAGFIVVLSIYLISGPQWIDNHLPKAWIDAPQIKFFVTLAKKLIVFVAIPFVVFRFAFGYRLRDFGIQFEGLRALVGNHLPLVLVVGGALLAFQYFAGGAAAPVRHGEFSAYQLLLGLPLCFIWLVIEVGLVEEFFFRALVQNAARSVVQIRSNRCCPDVARFWLGTRAWVHFSSGGQRGRSRPKSVCARRDRLFDRGALSQRDFIWRDVGANEKSVCAHAGPCRWRSSAEFRELCSSLAAVKEVWPSRVWAQPRSAL